MDQFQPGEQVYVRLGFQHVVPIKNAFIVFVHEEDEDQHIAFGFKSGDESKPIQPSQGGRLLDFAKTIERETRPGVYRLDKINFETFSGETKDYQGQFAIPRFEVIPERDFAPIVAEVSIYNELIWQSVREREQRGQ